MVQVNNSPVKKAMEIRRDEWITWNWINVTEQGQYELTYLRGNMRPIEESVRAGQEFDEWVKKCKARVKTKFLTH